MKIKRKCLLFFCLLGLSLTPLICLAETTPMSYLQKNFEEILSVLQSDSFKNKPEKEQQDEMYEKLNSSFDFHLISMLALGRNWRNFSSDQKNEFAKYFSRLVTNVYLLKIKGNNLEKIKVDYLKAVDLKTKSKKRSDVYTQFHNGEYEIPVVYRMIYKESGIWKIYDILIEGVSLVANYRDTYKTKVMVPPEIIINELKAKLENEKK